MTLSDPVIVLARWSAAEAHLGAVLELLKSLRAQSLAEAGCLGYEVFEQADEPGTLLLLERYRNEQAAQAHRDSSHYREHMDRIRPLLAARHVDFLRSRDL